jgi:hypothetical protein
MSNNKNDQKPGNTADDKKQAFKEGNSDNTTKIKTNNTGFIEDDKKNTAATGSTVNSKGK